MPDLTVSVATGNPISVSVSGNGAATATVSSGGTATVTVAGGMPSSAAGKTIVSSGGLGDLTSGQQAQITQGVIVVTTDGYRWIYSGSGSVTSQASYVQLADITPEWGAISGKPSTFAPSAHKASHATGGSDALTPSDIGAAAAADFDQPLKTTDSVSFVGVSAETLTATNVTIDHNGIALGLGTAGILFGDATLQETAWTGRIGTEPGNLVVTGAGGALTTSSSLSGYATIHDVIIPDIGTVTFPTDQSLGDVLNAIDGQLDNKADSSHNHGSLTSQGCIGTTSGQIVVTGAGGALTTAATIPASSVSGLATIATSGLPTASATVLGGVKIGSGISIDGSGVISASAAYTLPAATTSTLGGVIVGTGLSVSSGTASVTYGTTSGTACQGNDSRLSDSRTPTSHTHGNITNAGAIGSTSGLPLITTTSGVITVGSFGTSSGTFCQGNDSRLSDSRTPTAGSVNDASITSSGLSTSVLNWAAIADWAPSTSYAKGDIVNYLGVAYRRSVAGVSGASFNTANWQQVTPGTGSTASTLCIGNDSRLSDTRTPTDGSVTTAKLANSAVTVAKISATGTPSASTYLDGSGAWSAPTASVSYATTSQAQDLTATTVAMSPANVRTAIRSFSRVQYNTNFTASGGSVSSLNSTITASLVGGTSASGTAVTYQSGNGFSGRVRQGFDWSLPTAFNVSVVRQTCPSTGIARFLFGCLTAPFGWVTLDGRGIGFEIRQSRIWLLAHNGSSLTSVDSGIDTFSGDFQQEVVDIWIRSDGAGNVTLTRSLNGGTASSYTTTGGPTATTTGTGATAWAGVNNGATASSANFIFSPHLVSIQ